MLDLMKLLKKIFGYKPEEKILILYDTPTIKDNKEWKNRRKLAYEWQENLKKQRVKTEIAFYSATYANYLTK